MFRKRDLSFPARLLLGYSDIKRYYMIALIYSLSYNIYISDFRIIMSELDILNEKMEKMM